MGDLSVVAMLLLHGSSELTDSEATGAWTMDAFDRGLGVLLENLQRT